MAIRDKIWFFATKNHPQGLVLTRPLALLNAILYPKRALLAWLKEDCGYNIYTNSWTIHGTVFSDGFLRALARETPTGRCFVVKNSSETEASYPILYASYYNLVKDPFTGEEFVKIMDHPPNDSCANQ